MRSPPIRRAESLRWWVHVGLIGTVVISLCFEPMLTIHIVVRLVFIGLCVAHLRQRRRITSNLLRRLVHPLTLYRTQGRLAVADAVLAALTIVMLTSGLWDWLSGHPTRIRWHAISGVLLTGLLLVHTVRRGSRLRSSHITWARHSKLTTAQSRTIRYAAKRLYPLCRE
ncbi:MAG: hypothetical protein ABI232_04300 [Jatrophihabitantaceae bacterium]